jgi:hypothetical protein
MPSLANCVEQAAALLFFPKEKTAKQQSLA